jgi:hypothetical protein
MAIGGRDQAFLCVIADNSASPLKVNSDWPWKRGILQPAKGQHTIRIIQCTHAQSITYFHMMQFSAGAYFAFPPAPTLTSTLAELRGVGILRTTLCA